MQCVPARSQACLPQIPFQSQLEVVATPYSSTLPWIAVTGCHRMSIAACSRSFVQRLARLSSTTAALEVDTRTVAVCHAHVKQIKSLTMDWICLLCHGPRKSTNFTSDQQRVCSCNTRVGDSSRDCFSLTVAMLIDDGTGEVCKTDLLVLIGAHEN